MGETHLIPVVSSQGGGIIHVLDFDVTVNQSWSPGNEGKTICGRTGVWFMSGLVIDGDRPCKQCDAKTSVAVEMFASDAQFKRTAQAAFEYTFSNWVQFGIHAGFIDEPSCYVHQGIPMTDEELDEMGEDGEPDDCVFILRVYYP